LIVFVCGHGCVEKRNFDFLHGAPGLDVIKNEGMGLHVHMKDVIGDSKQTAGLWGGRGSLGDGPGEGDNGLVFEANRTFIGPEVDRPDVVDLGVGSFICRDEGLSVGEEGLCGARGAGKDVGLEPLKVRGTISDSPDKVQVGTRLGATLLPSDAPILGRDASVCVIQRKAGIIDFEGTLGEQVCVQGNERAPLVGARDGVCYALR
tara:strand:+ start:269 stop:883 length:615 start_codon:yes stop_codon:yes gene_type:complete